MNENEIAVVEKQEIQVQAQSPVAAAMRILSANKDFDTDKLGAILELQMKHEGNEARKEFASDFTIAQSSMGSVAKTAYNKQTSSYYAKLEGVIDACKPVYTEHGFSVIFYEGETEKADQVRVCADVMHRSGHEKTYHLDVPLDGVGIKGNANMTKIHGKASSVSYGERYLLCMIWNLPTEDNDGNGNGTTQKTKTTQPTADEAKAIGKVFDALLDSVDDDKMIDLDEFTKLMYSRGGNKYPQIEGLVASDWAKWVIKGKWLNLACKLKTNN